MKDTLDAVAIIIGTALPIESRKRSVEEHILDIELADLRRRIKHAPICVRRALFASFEKVLRDQELCKL